MKTKHAKSIILSLIMAIAMLCSSVISTPVQAAGTETLPLGSYAIGSFTFTNTNITPVKTMPAGAQKLTIVVAFRKADTDAGIGQVKLTVQIRDLSGRVVASKVVPDQSNYECGSFKRFTNLCIADLPVSPGQQYQIFFDATIGYISFFKL